LGYISILLILATIILLVLIAFGIAQLSCNTFSDPNMKYKICQQITGKVFSIAVIVSLIACAGCGIYYSVLYYDSIWRNINIISDEILKENKYSQNTAQFYKAINTSVVNISIPAGIKNINESTFFLNNLIITNLSTASLIDRLAPIIIYSLIIILGILSIFAIISERKILLGISAAILIIMFIIVLVSALTGGIMSLFLSNYCVGGVDSQTQNIIAGVQLENCTKQTIHYYFTCKYSNQSCNPFPSTFAVLGKSITELTAKINNDTSNPDVRYWNDTLKTLKGLNGSVYTLSQCSEIQGVYKKVTSDICGEASKNLIMLSSLWNLSTGILFIYFLILMFSWNRLKSRWNVHTGYELLDEEKGSTELNKRGTRASTRNSVNNYNKFNSMEKMGNACDLTGKCFAFVTFVLVWWIIMIAGVVMIYIFGVSKTENVNRIK